MAKTKSSDDNPENKTMTVKVDKSGRLIPMDEDIRKLEGELFEIVMSDSTSESKKTQKSKKPKKTQKSLGKLDIFLLVMACIGMIIGAWYGVNLEVKK